MKNVPFDKRAEFKEHVAPIVAKLEKTCIEHEIPFYFSAAVENSPDGTQYEERARTAGPYGLILTDDQLVNHVKVSAGFEVIVPESIPDIRLN